MTLIQKAALFFAGVFLVVFIVTNIPAFNDAQGYNFGLFKIDPIDNIVHLLTVLIGAFAAWYSAQVSRWFLILFGTFYGLDALVGLFTQQGLLDFTVILQAASNVSKILNPDLGIKNFLINAPHVGISIAMVVSGCWGVLSRARSITELKMRIR